MHDHLRSILRQLRLSGLAASLDVRIQEAQASRLSHLEFLELILQDEVAVRDHRRIDRRTKFAGFRDLKTLDQFDWEFNAQLPRRQLFELATCKFLDDARDILLMGPPGTGKTHIAIGVGRPDWVRAPLPPNRAGGSPAHGSPVDGFTSRRIERPRHGRLPD